MDTFRILTCAFAGLVIILLLIQTYLGQSNFRWLRKKIWELEETLDDQRGDINELK